MHERAGGDDDGRWAVPLLGHAYNYGMHCAYAIMRIFCILATVIQNGCLENDNAEEHSRPRMGEAFHNQSVPVSEETEPGEDKR